MWLLEEAVVNTTSLRIERISGNTGKFGHFAHVLLLVLEPFREDTDSKSVSLFVKAVARKHFAHQLRFEKG